MKQGCFIIAVLMFFAQAFPDLTKPLYLREYWGVERVEDYVSGGVPLPKGLFSSGDRISIYDGSGTQMPVQTRPLMRWPDGSLRWVLVTFPMDASPHAATTGQIRFHRDAAASQPTYAQGQINVTENATHITVSTGKLTFKVRKSGGFNLFDQVLIAKDGDNVVDDEIVSSSLENGAVIYDSRDSTYTSGHDPAMTATVEESGPLYAIIKVTGNHSNGTSDHRFYGYLCRIYAYAGKSYVNVQYTVKNSYFKPRGALAFNGMSLKLKANLSGAQQMTLFDSAKYAAALADSAYVFQPYQYGYETRVNGNTLHTVDTSDHDARTLGWVDLSDADWGVSVGVYEFASNCPKEIFAARDGDLQARLWPKRYVQGTDSINYARGSAWDKGETDRFFIGIGEHKTHKVCFYFHAGDAAAADAERVMGAFNHPLLPQMDKQWISLTRAVPGEIFPAAAAIPDPANAAHHLPVVNRPLCHPAYTGAEGANWTRGYYDSWVTFGNAFWRNETGDTEFFENQGTRYWRHLSPYIYRLLESSAYVYGDMRRSHVDSVVGYNHISMHFWLCCSVSVRDPVHSAPLPDGPRNVGYQRVWIAPTPGNQSEHYTSRDLFMYYLTSGDLKIRDACYEFTETMPQYIIWKRGSASMTKAARGDAATASSIWMSAMIENSDTVNGVNVQDYFKGQIRDFFLGTGTKGGILGAMEPFGAWGDTSTQNGFSGPHNFMEALVDMPFSWFAEYFWNDSLSYYVDKRKTFWRDLVIGDSGGMLYHGFAPPDSLDSPLQTSISNWRVPAGLAMQYYLNQDSAFARKMNMLCMEGANPRFFVLNIDHSYFTDKYDITAFQAYMFYVNNKGVFFQNPIITWDNDPSITEKGGGGPVACGFTAFPNPFNPEVRLGLSLKSGLNGRDAAEFFIYSIDGRLVSRLKVSPGSRDRYAAVWQGKDVSGRCVAAGLYIVRAILQGKKWEKKILLIK